MHKISSYSDLKRYTTSEPISFSWYGPRSCDVSELEDLIHINGIIACYGSERANKATPTLLYETEKVRQKFSIDDLARILIAKGRLEKFATENKIEAILPYDSNLELESFCKTNNVAYFSSPDKLKDILRDKTNIDYISRAIGMPTIPGEPGLIDDLEYQPLVEKFGLPLFLHFAEGAGGSGNRIVNSKDEFESVKVKQKGKRLNVKKYFTGTSCTIDVCVTSTSILCGALEEMVIGSAPLCSNPTEYVASSWFDNNYSYDLRVKISKIGIALGEYLRNKGFIGMFHPDFLVGKDGQVFLTELNMRFGGSCGAYAKIQMHSRQVPLIIASALSFLRPELEFDQKSINELNLSPLNYALLVMKNYSGTPVTIPAKYKSGVYSLERDLFEHTGRTKFAQMANENEIFINGLPSSSSDSIVQPGAYICEIMTKFPISNSKSKLNENGEKLAYRLFDQLTS